MGEEKFLLTLTVDGRNYPLKIKRTEEQAFRHAAKKINTKINQYRNTFGAESNNLIAQDFVVMTAIQALVENFELGDKNYTKPFEDKISLLINNIDTYLSEE